MTSSDFSIFMVWRRCNAQAAKDRRLEVEWPCLSSGEIYALWFSQGSSTRPRLSRELPKGQAARESQREGHFHWRRHQVADHHT